MLWCHFLREISVHHHSLYYAGALPRVLIVDDDQLATDTRALILCKMGFEVEVAKSGVEALQRPDIHSFGVIVLDYDMPHLNGLETARLLRDLGVSSRLVMLSGRVDAPPGAFIDVFVSKGEGIHHLTTAILNSHSGRRIPYKRAPRAR